MTLEQPMFIGSVGDLSSNHQKSSNIRREVRLALQFQI